MDVILNINNLTYLNIFENLSIYLEKNKIITISGPNNCGKTTLFKILCKKIKGNFNIILNSKGIYEFSDKEYDDNIQVVYQDEKIISNNTAKELIDIQQERYDKEKVDFLVKGLKLKKVLNKKIYELSDKENFMFRIAFSILNSKCLVLIDDIDQYLYQYEVAELYSFFRECTNKYNLTFILTCIELDSAIYSDELYIINDKKITLKGDPLYVLSKDNILNKIGLEVPFIIDLSVKLRDYELIDKIPLDQGELINKLWK